MSCNNIIPLQTVADQVAAILAANYIDKDDPRITNGVFTSPSIRGEFLLDAAAKDVFCNLVQNCVTAAPFGKTWLDRPVYPDAVLVSYEEAGQTKYKWSRDTELVPGKMLLPVPPTTDSVAVSYDDAGETKVRWETLESVVADNAPPMRDENISTSRGVTQEALNLGVESVDQLLAIENPQSGLRIYVKSYVEGANRGGGEFVYDSAKANINDGGNVISGWVRQGAAAASADPFDYGAIGDGVYDDTTAFKNLAASSRAICPKTGRYVIKQPLTLLANATILGEGEVVLDMSEAQGRTLISSYDTELIELPRMSADVAAHDRHVYFAAPHGLKKGDVVVIYNPTDFSWESSRDYYRAGERFRVASVVSPTQITTEVTLYESYKTADVYLYKHKEVVSAHMANFTLVGNPDRANPTDGIKLSKCVDSSVINVRVYNCSYTQLNINQCYNVAVYGCTTIDDMSTDFSGDYGLAIGNSQTVRVSGSYLMASRHGSATGGNTGVGCVTNIDLIYEDCTIGCMGGSHAADMHQNTAYSKYSRCTIRGSVGLAGHANVLEFCEISEGNTEEGNDVAVNVNCAPSAEHTIRGNIIRSTKTRTNPNTNCMINTGLSLRTLRGGVLTIEDNQIYWDNLSGADSLAGVIGTISVSLRNNMVGEVHVRVNNNIFKNLGSNSVSNFVYLRTLGSSERAVNMVTVNNNHVEGALRAVGVTMVTGAAAERFKTVSIAGNYIERCDNMGILVQSATHATVTNNELVDCSRILPSSSTLATYIAMWDVVTAIEANNITRGLKTTTSYRASFARVGTLYRTGAVDLLGLPDYESAVTTTLPPPQPEPEPEPVVP